MIGPISFRLYFVEQEMWALHKICIAGLKRSGLHEILIFYLPRGLRSFGSSLSVDPADDLEKSRFVIGE